LNPETRQWPTVVANSQRDKKMKKHKIFFGTKKKKNQSGAVIKEK